MMEIPIKAATASTIALLAFLGGWWAAGPRSVYAQDSAPQLDVRTVGAESAFVVQYPGQKKAYVYLSPFVGSPNISCTYSFTLSTPGGPITRDQCTQ